MVAVLPEGQPPPRSYTYSIMRSNRFPFRIDLYLAPFILLSHYPCWMLNESTPHNSLASIYHIVDDRLEVMCSVKAKKNRWQNIIFVAFTLTSRGFYKISNRTSWNFISTIPFIFQLFHKGQICKAHHQLLDVTSPELQCASWMLLSSMPN